MLKKYLFFCLVSGFLFFLGKPVYAQTVVPDAAIPWYDGFVGFLSEVVTLNNPVQLNNPPKEFSLAQKPSFVLSTPMRIKERIGQTSENVWNTQQEQITAAIVTKDGKSFPVTIKKTAEGRFALLATTASLPHGSLTLKIAAKETTFYTRNLSQNFSWGVIAVNTNKSVFSSHETAHLYFGVVDNDGNTVCDAEITATLTSPNGKQTILTTKNDTIQHNTDCPGVTYGGDYSATYKTTIEGQYNMHITATTKQGTHAIDDYFIVKDNEPFVIERSKAASRIYPASAYDMAIKVTANEDYKGVVKDIIPKAFKVTDVSDGGTVPDAPNYPIITPSVDVLAHDKEAYSYLSRVSDLMYENVSQIDHTPMPIVWHVDWKKGQTYTLSYTLHYPNISPEFLLIGPFQVGNTHTLFKEARQWQIAADATTKCWVGSAGGGWNTAANWQLTTGGATTVPGSSDIATFDPGKAVCTSASTTDANNTINTTFSVAGILVESSFTQTITQAGALTVGTSNYSQAGGTFTGASQSITLNGSYTLSGGTFTSTTGTLKEFTTWNTTGGTFVANGGTVWFDNNNTTYTITPSTETYNNVKLDNSDCANGNGNFTIASGTTLTVAGTLTLTNDKIGGCTGITGINGPGGISAQGDISLPNTHTNGANFVEGSAVITINGTGTQTMTGVASGSEDKGSVPFININKPSGTLNIRNTITATDDWTWTQGTVDYTGSTVWFTAAHDRGATITPGATAFNNIGFDATGCPSGTTTITIASGSTLTAAGSVTFDDSQGSTCGAMNVNGTGTIVAQGNISTLSSASGSVGGTVTLTLSGSGSQTVTKGTEAFPSGSWTINKSGGTVTLAAALSLSAASQALTLSNGTLDLAGFNLTVNSALSQSGGILTMQGGETVTTGSTSITGGTINYNGASTYTSFPMGNTYQSLSFSGSGTYSPSTALTVNKNFSQSAGTFNAPTNLTVDGNFTISGGVFNAGSNTVTIADNTQTTLITGPVSFYNITSVTPGKTIQFAPGAGSMVTVTNTITMRGNSSSAVFLRSSSTGNQWYINVATGGTTNLSYLDVKDSNACSSASVTITTKSSTNSGNNACWVFPSNSWYNSNWGYRIRITVNHTKVPSALTNFPVLVSLTNATIAAHALSNGNDILFTDSDGVTLLPYEIEHYNSVTGELESWVQVPTVSSSTDTVFYLYFGNPSATSQQNVNGVWDTDFMQVLHFAETSGSSVNDSTSKANSGTKYSNGSISSSFPAPITSGEIDGAQSFTSANSSYMQTSNTSFPTGDFTFEFWFQPSTVANMYVLNSNNAIWFDYNITSANKITLHLTGAAINVTSNTSLSAGSWYFIAGTRSGSNVTLYVNGSSDKTGSGSTAISYGTCGVLVIGSNTTTGNCNGNGGSYANGIIDEVRVSDIARSSAWIQAEYNNASSPSSFLTIFPVTNPPSVQIHGGVKFQGGSKLKAN